MNLYNNLQGVLALEESGPGRIEPVLVLDVGLLLGLVVRIFADLLVLLSHVFHFVGGHYALGDQLIGVFLQSWIRK